MTKKQKATLTEKRQW